MNKIIAVIPFYNERNTINSIIENVEPYVDTILAVNDGSTDNFLSILKDYKNLILLNHGTNKGKGAALNTGFIKSVELNSKITITIDADLQHDPSKIPEMIEKHKFADIIIGNRLKDISTMPFQRKLSNKITSFLMSRKTGQKIIDSQCGYRSYKTNILKNILPTSTGFEAESEILVLASRINYRIDFIEIPTIYADETSKMRPLQAIIGFVKVILFK